MTHDCNDPKCQAGHEEAEAWIYREIAAVAAARARCDSPAEVNLLCAFISYFNFLPLETGRGAPLPMAQFDGQTGYMANIGSLYQQLEVGRYRLDFAIINGVCRTAVEVDGHNFHERTKEQAQHDKSRDRYLVGEGWRVLRFTGREVYADAFACATQAIAIATDAHCLLARITQANAIATDSPRPSRFNERPSRFNELKAALFTCVKEEREVRSLNALCAKVSGWQKQAKLEAMRELIQEGIVVSLGKGGPFRVKAVADEQ